jgi:hypothetical protein
VPERSRPIPTPLRQRVADFRYTGFQVTVTIAATVLIAVMLVGRANRIDYVPYAASTSPDQVASSAPSPAASRLESVGTTIEELDRPDDPLLLGYLAETVASNSVTLLGSAPAVPRCGEFSVGRKEDRLSLPPRTTRVEPQLLEEWSLWWPHDSSLAQPEHLDPNVSGERVRRFAGLAAAEPVCSAEQQSSGPTYSRGSY